MTYLCPEGDYIVTFDPLDGSSIIDCNLAVGSIFAIWKRIPGKQDMNGRTGREIVGAALAIYGSRTNVLIYNDLKNQVDELTLQKTDSEDYIWVETKSDIKIRP